LEPKFTLRYALGKPPKHLGLIEFWYPKTKSAPFQTANEH